MQPAQRGAIRRRTERAGNVAATLPRCQPRLRFSCATASKKIGAHGDAPRMRQHPREFLTLIVAALALARSREGHGHQRCPLALDVGGKANLRHSSRHRWSDTRPAVVLERMHHSFGRSAGHRIRRAHGAHVWRQQRAPRTRDRSAQWIEGVSASVAARSRKLLGAKPARSADELRFVRLSCCAADATRWRKQEIEQRRAGLAQK